MKLKKISKKTYLIMLSVILVLVTMIGTSFGFFMKVDEKDVNYQTGILSIELVTSGDPTFSVTKFKNVYFLL